MSEPTYYEKNREKVLSYQNRYRKSEHGKKVVYEANKRYREKNKEKFKAYFREYQLKNREKLNAKMRVYNTKRRLVLKKKALLNKLCQSKLMNSVSTYLASGQYTTEDLTKDMSILTELLTIFAKSTMPTQQTAQSG
jgi:hypothetical protein